MTKPAETDPYKGREHAEVKHHLLKTYFERFLMILGQPMQRLAYVDAFSGPWKSSNDGHSDTSFGLAWQTAVDCSAALANMNRHPKIRQLWIEADSDCYGQLEAFAGSCSSQSVKITTIPGRFEEQIDEIVRWIGNDHAFVLVDPLGYKGLIEPGVLAPLLALPRVEVMINYMWQFIDYAARQGDQLGNRANLLRIFGSRFDKITATENRAERERALLEEYEARLRDAGGREGTRRARVMSFPIHYAGQEKTKYYLAFLTHSAKGLITFAETTEKAADKQQQVFYSTHERRRVERSGTGDLFKGMANPETPEAEPNTQSWLEVLLEPGSELVVDDEMWAVLLERARCRPSQLQSGLQLLIQDGVVSNLDSKRPRKKNFVHYAKAERLKRLK